MLGSLFEPGSGGLCLCCARRFGFLCSLGRRASRALLRGATSRWAAHIPCRCRTCRAESARARPRWLVRAVPHSGADESGVLLRRRRWLGPRDRLCHRLLAGSARRPNLGTRVLAVFGAIVSCIAAGRLVAWFAPRSASERVPVCPAFYTLREWVVLFVLEGYASRAAAPRRRHLL